LYSSSERALFLTDIKFVDFIIPGGVQLCTQEFIEYLRASGIALNIYKINPRISYVSRIKNKIGVEAYDLYDIDYCLDDIINIINAQNIKLVFFNQLNLAYNTIKIKKAVPQDVKFIGLSHGNESGDYVHEVTKTKNSSVLKTWRVGKLIIKEKRLFSELLDGVITISNQETFIDQWLGANNILFLPRILKPSFLKRMPIAGIMGFVGTLDHLPNYLGLEKLSVELQFRRFKGTIMLIGGPQNKGYEFQKKYDFIEYCGVLSDAQLQGEMATWSLFINPVFWYSRGSSTKLSLALNKGIPVLSTPAGARGYELKNLDILSSDNSPSSFAKQIIDTLNDPGLLANLETSSKQNALEFKINTWANQLTNYLNKL
jgi:hypothetical protein